MRLFILLFSFIFFAFGCGGEPPSRLTKENLQASLCRPDHELKYYQDSEDSFLRSSWKWKCSRILEVEQKSPTHVRIRVLEKGSRERLGSSKSEGLRLDHSGRVYTERYERTSRYATYELGRDSIDDRWYIDTSNGKPVRRLWLFKRHIKIRPDKSSK